MQDQMTLPSMDKSAQWSQFGKKVGGPYLTLSLSMFQLVTPPAYSISQNFQIIRTAQRQYFSNSAKHI